MSGNLMRLLAEVEDLIRRVRAADPPRPGGAGRLVAALTEAESAARAYLAGNVASVYNGTYSSSGPPPTPAGYECELPGVYSRVTPPSMM